jgi:uncharacterized membrane protein YfcA
MPPNRRQRRKTTSTNTMAHLHLQIILGALLAGFVQGASGFALALIATSIWIWLVEPQLLVPLVLISSLVGHLTSIQAVRKNFVLSRARPFLIGGVLGVLPGIYIFNHINQDVFKLSIGAILVLYCSTMLLVANLPKMKAGGAFLDGCIGGISGIMGGLGGLSGPAPIIWCALRGWDRHTQRATFQPLLIVIGILTLLVYGLTGGITAQSLQLAALVAPAIIVSSWLGAKAYHWIPEAAFRKLLLLLLLASGLALLVPSIHKLYAAPW